MSVYGYIRVSHHAQAKSGLGLAAQKRKIEEAARALRKRVDRMFRDAAVSASRRPLMQRRAGWELDQAAKAGDHILIARLDRAFRSLRDFAGVMERWHKRGVYVHLLDLGVDTSAPVGQLVAGIMASIAQWESQRIGERIRDAKAVQRAQGRSSNGRAPIGYRLFRRRLVVDQVGRKIARSIVGRRERGASYLTIAAELNRRRQRTGEGKPWSHQAVWRAERAARLRFPITHYTKGAKG